MSGIETASRFVTDFKNGLVVVDGFSKQSARLRREFDERFSDPENSERAHPKSRFVWDFWHVPGKFRLLRTTPEAVFSKPLLEEWIRELAEFGRETLGVHGLSPIWLSCYTDGCEQRWHRDRPHGSWAFVYSLSPKIRGGETEIVFQQKKLKIKPRANRLVVFDPSRVHRVRKVSQAQGVLDGRLVMHGWFVFPRPYVEGFVTAREFQRAIDGWWAMLRAERLLPRSVKGSAVFRVRVRATGGVQRVEALTSTLRGWTNRQRQVFEASTIAYWGAQRFKAQKQASRLTVPITC